MLWQQLKMALACGRRRRLTTLTVSHPAYMLYLRTNEPQKRFARSRHIYTSLSLQRVATYPPTDVSSSINGTSPPVSGKNSCKVCPSKPGFQKKKKKVVSNIPPATDLNSFSLFYQCGPMTQCAACSFPKSIPLDPGFCKKTMYTCLHMQPCPSLHPGSQRKCLSQIKTTWILQFHTVRLCGRSSTPPPLTPLLSHPTPLPCLFFL